jgi:Na+-translocating ferredoxin:NAD+ oxidoreductase RnfC subunit
MTPNARWITFLIISVIISLTSGCERERKSIESRCDYDGVKIEPLYAVYFNLQDGTEKKFCSIVCASMSFSQLQRKVKEAIVVDESSERKMNASQAFFVESEMINVPHVKNRIHVFAKEEDALRHSKKFSGRRIENPFKR